MKDNDKFNIAIKYRNILVYRVHSRYPHILYDTILDLYSDVCFQFVKYYDNSKINEINLVYSYLLTCLTNACKNWMRDVEDALDKGNCLSLDDLREKTNEEHEIFQEESLIENPYERIEELQHADYIYALILQGMPQTLRLIIHLFYIEGVKIKDIMRELKITSFGKMATLFKRARKLVVLRLLEIKKMRKEGLL